MNREKSVSAETSYRLVWELRRAEERLLEITSELHTRVHAGRGRSKYWYNCWVPACVETRRVFGEEISDIEVIRHNDQRLKVKAKRKKRQ